MVRRAALLFLVLLLALPLQAAKHSDWNELTSCRLYQSGDYQKAMEAGSEVLDGDQSPELKVEAAKCVASSQVVLKQPETAKETIAGMLALDSGARFSPDYDYPAEVISLYHTVRDSVGPETMDIRTVAIGDFENNSVYTGTFKNLDFSLFAPALVHLITADLAEATPLRVVDRQRTETIMKEIQLSAGGFADPKSAVEAGHLLGAHTFIFGQYMVLSKDTVRIDARVVHTATGEVILTKQVTGKFSGKPERFMELERELVLALARGIEDIARNQGATMELMHMTEAHFQTKEETIRNRPRYVEETLLTAQALEQEEKGAYREAENTWGRVQAADPENQTAGLRLHLLSSLTASAD